MILRNIVSFINRIRTEGFFHIIIGNTLVKCLNFLSAMLVARILTKGQLGLISYVDNLYSYFFLISGMGVSNGIMRYCTMAETPEERVGFFIFGARFGLFFQTICLLILGVLAFFLPFPFPHTDELILCLLLTLIFNFIYDYLLTYLRVELQFQSYIRVTVFYTALLVFGIVILASCLQVGGVILARYAANFLSCLLVFFLVKQIFKKNGYQIKNAVISKPKKRELLSFSCSNLMGVALSTMMPLNEAFLINNILRNSAVSADFKIAMTIPYNILFVTQSVFLFAFPYFVKRQKDLKWIRKSAIFLCLGLTCFYFVSFIVYALLSKWLIVFLFGEKYIEITGLSTLLFLAYSINAGIRLVPLNIIIAMGFARFNAVLSLLSVTIQLLVDSLLIYFWGIHGAVYGIMIVYLITGAYCWKYLFKQTKVRE